MHELQLDPGATVDSGNDLHSAGVQLNDSMYQRQAQASSVGRVALFGATEESMKGPFAAFFAEPWPVIPNPDGDVLLIARDLDADLRARSEARCSANCAKRFRARLRPRALSLPRMSRQSGYRAARQAA